MSDKLNIIGPYLVPATEAGVRALVPAPGVETVFWDKEIRGLQLRASASGTLTWRYVYRNRKRQKRYLTLGRSPGVKRADAVKAAKIYAGQVAIGNDPADQRDSAKAEQKAQETFGSAAERFLKAQEANLRPSSLDQCQRHLRLYSRQLANIQLDRILPRTIVECLDEISGVRGIVAANRTRSTLLSCFKWLSGRSEFPSSIFQDLQLIPKSKERSRERVIDLEELKAIWIATAEETTFNKIVRLLILTGARRTEIGELKAEEIEQDWIKLQPERVKNSEIYIIPRLPLINQYLPLVEKGYVFGKNGFSGWSGAVKRLRNRVDAIKASKGIIENSNYSNWTLHDLRRTISTFANEHSLGPPHIIEMVLGHKLRGIASIYNRSEHRSQIQDLLQKWHLFLRENGVVND